MTKQGDPQKETMTGAEGSPEATEDLAKSAKEQAAEERSETKVAAQPEPPRDDATKVADVPDEVAEAEPEPEAEAEAPAEEKPKRRRRKKAEEPAAAEADADGEDESAEADAKPAEEKPKRRRRGAAETTTAAEPKRAPRRDADGTVVVRAQAKYVRMAPRKARLVVDHIRGKSVEEARAILQHTPRAASTDVLKVLNSAVANAENNHEIFADELKIHQAFVDEGPTIKRFRPRAQGRATRIRKRTSHLTITLTPKE